mmetsp:Transcript_13456/g.43014  ORF Transcript_13456/g.43014 Transcript_13456/m.43014 type:complete len:239 (-) Transcript_13456:452-1168(-)
MATLARPIARRRGTPLTSSLRSLLRRLPLEQFELPVIRKRLDAALAEAGPAAPPSLVGALHTAAVVSCAERQRWDLLAPLLRAAASDRSHGAGAYTAALDAIARAGPAGASSCEVGGEAGGGEEEGGTTASRRLALSRGVADDMRAAGHGPSRLTSTAAALPWLCRMRFSTRPGCGQACAASSPLERARRRRGPDGAAAARDEERAPSDRRHPQRRPHHQRLERTRGEAAGGARVLGG